MSFDPAFRFYREDPQTRACLHAIAAAAAELRAELADRRTLYPRLVAKGRMTQEAMDRELRIMAALVADHAPASATDHRTAAQPPVATWTEKVHALRREIGLRRTLYPRWVAAHRLDQTTADARLTLLEEIHELYWFNATGDEAKAARADTAARARRKLAA